MDKEKGQHFCNDQRTSFVKKIYSKHIVDAAE